MNFIKKFIYKIIGKKIGKSVGLIDDSKEIAMGETVKKWYKSKTIWSIVANAVVGIIQVVKPELMGTEIASILIAIATTVGIYGRASANTIIK